MAIILYDAIPSSNSDRVKIALHEKGLAYERVTLDLAKKEQKRPQFLKLNASSTSIWTSNIPTLR